jgi:hypothetical protein
LGGFIGSTGNENHYAKPARDDGRKPNPKKTQIGEEGKRVFSESFEENPREEDPIPDRQFCIRSISTVARKGFNGLYSLVKETLQQEPTSGFCSYSLTNGATGLRF